MLRALAGGQVDAKREDKGMMGIFNQNGQTGFRYAFALTTHQNAFDPLAAMRFALEHQNPLVTGAITGSRDSYPTPSFSLLQTSDPGVLLWSLKPSEDGIGAGAIARFWNLTDKPTTPTLTLAQPIRQAWKTTHIETDEGPLQPTGKQLPIRFAPHQLNTYRLRF